jgi:cytochrome c-type biogenesis protein CcmH/NrfG
MGAMSYVSDGLRFAPNGAWPLEEMGALQLQRVRIATDPRIGQDAARAAHVFLHRALRERPTSPFAWANLALAKLYLGEVDSELLDALAHSGELGPWEPEVQQALAFVGLAVWRELGADGRALIVQAVERIARKDPDRALEIGAAFNRLDLICGTETAASHAGQICSRAHASTKQAKRP